QVSDDCNTDTDSIKITVEPCTCQVFVSNVFSPNGDGINDMFITQASCAIINYHLTIYDRYGGLLFESTVAGEGWDGTVKSKNAQSGVYVYALTYAFEDGDTKRIHGDVTLLR
ncbi:MAG: gliding motility-associated C-terminal domain-containing protein, partial [Saprospiraceae bacterium]|nr:gliding motility-associated C-terminal domain-containing protein [Saprospiraceae bacterium]